MHQTLEIVLDVTIRTIASMFLLFFIKIQSRNDPKNEETTFAANMQATIAKNALLMYFLQEKTGSKHVCKRHPRGYMASLQQAVLGVGWLVPIGPHRSHGRFRGAESPQGAARGAASRSRMSG